MPVSLRIPDTDTAVRSSGRQATRSGRRTAGEAPWVASGAVAVEETVDDTSAGAAAMSQVGSAAAAEASQVASTAADQAADVASTVSQKGRQLAGSAVDATRDVTGTVQEQISVVKGEVTEQGRSLAEEAKSQVERHAHAQSQRLADTLLNIGSEVQALAEGRVDDAENLKPYLSSAADAVYNAADRVYDLSSDIDNNHGIAGVLEDLQSFARRRPGAFLLGAAVAGFGIGRAVRANQSNRSDGDPDLDGPGTITRRVSASPKR